VLVFLVSGRNPSLLSGSVRFGRRPWGGAERVADAARYGQLGIARLLLDAGADPNQVRGVGTPLGAAAAGGHADLIHLLLQKGARINGSDYRGRTAPSIQRAPAVDKT